MSRGGLAVARRRHEKEEKGYLVEVVGKAGMELAEDVPDQGMFTAFLLLGRYAEAHRTEQEAWWAYRALMDELLLRFGWVVEETGEDLFSGLLRQTVLRREGEVSVIRLIAVEP